MNGEGHGRAEDVTRRPALAADLDFLLELRRLTMTEHQLAAGLVPSEDERRARVLVRYDCAQILCLAGQRIGLMKVARDGRHWDLIQIHLLPEFQGLGLGRALIDELLAEARAAGASISLNVLKGNPARRLYERLGFEVLEEGGHFTRMRIGPAPPSTSHADAAPGAETRE